MSMHVRDEGQGPPVLLLHGLMASSFAFDAVIQRGRSRLRLIAVDLPRSGKSGHYADSNPESIARAVAAELAKRGVHSATVVGHSFGGVVASALANQHPALVKRLVLVSSPLLGLPAAARAFFSNPLLDQGARALGNLPVLRPAIRAYMQTMFGDPRAVTEAMVDGYLESLRAPGTWPAMLEALRAIGGYQVPTQALRAVPTEVVWGDADRLVPLVQGERLAVSLDAPFRVLPRVGHFVPEEAPDAVLEAIDGVGDTRKAKERSGRVTT
jgi:pimeloyl-ACP methyl ester carboxylesterase